MLPIQYLIFQLIILFFELQNPSISSPSSIGHRPSLNELSHNASSLFMHGKYQESQALCDTILRNLQDEWSWDLYYKTIFQLSEIYRINRKFDHAEQLLNRAGDSLAQHHLGQAKYAPYFHYYIGCLELDNMKLEASCRSLYHALNDNANGTCNDSLRSIILNKIGNIKFYRGEYDSAYIYYQRAYNIIKNIENNFIELSSCLQNLGIIYSIKGDLNNSKIHLFKSLYLKMKIYNLQNYSFVKIYTNIGRYYYNISNFDSALLYFRLGGDIILRTQNINSPEAANIFWNQGLCYGMTGDYINALNYLLYAKDVYNLAYDGRFPLYNSLLMDIGLMYDLSECPQQAIDYYMQCKCDENNYLSIKLFRNLGNCYNKIHDFEQANKYFLKALSLLDSFKFPENEIAITKMNYGRFLIENGCSNGVELLKEASNIFTSLHGKYNRDVLKIYALIGDFYNNKNNFNKSLEYYHYALINHDINLSEFNPLIHLSDSIIPNDILYAEVYLKKAITLYEVYKETYKVKYLIASIQNFHITTNLIDKIRDSYQQNESKFSIGKDFRTLEEQALLACLEAFRVTGDSTYLDEAFYFSEKNKSIVLLSEMKESDALDICDAESSLKNYNRAIKLEIEASRDQINKEKSRPSPDFEKITRLESGLFILEMKFDSLKCYLERYHPEYGKIRRQLNIAGIRQVQHELKADEAMLMYTLGEDEIIIFLITSDGFDYCSVPVDEPLGPAIHRLNSNFQFFDALNYGNEDYAAYQHLAHLLYQKLIEPLKEKIHDRKLIIIPDEELGYLSFDVLLEKVDIRDSVDFTRLPFLLRKHPISYSGSATLFIFDRKKPVKPMRTGVLAVAPDYGRVTRTGFWGSIKPMRETSRRKIPGAREEAIYVHRRVGGKLLVGDRATKENFLREAGNYDIIHLSQHTRIDKNHPMSSQLSFYPFRDTISRGGLKAYEIYAMDLNAQLAVLSACNTGGGKLEQGEGINSIARAFMYAGVPSVVTTLWDVEDRSSQKLVQGLYHYLQMGMDKDEALQRAKLDYLKSTPCLTETHPAFWAGYVLYGDSTAHGFTSEKDLPADASLAFIFLAILAICTAAILYLRKKRLNLHDN